MRKQFRFDKFGRECEFARMILDSAHQLEIVTLVSGAKSLRLKESRETFHPVIGPEREARILHVEQQRLAERAREHQGKFVIWDVGFGASANAIAALEALKHSSGDIEMHSFDVSQVPILFALDHAIELGYLVSYQDELKELIGAGEARVGRVNWKFHLGDFRSTMKDAPAPNAVFYDPYSPSMNVEMWELSHFEKLRALLPASSPCLLTNYTRSTVVRVTLLRAGFFVGIGSLIGMKEETTVFSNDLSLLERPLERSWLEKRVRISHSAAPLRGQYSIEPISAEDYQALLVHPQFSTGLQ